MKTKVIDKMPINWDIVNLVRSKKGTIILTNGESRNGHFSGVAIASPDLCIGLYSETWDKPAFELVTETITIEFNSPD